MNFDEAIAYWQQSYAGYRADGNSVGAVRVARMLGYMYGIVVGDWAIGSGWITRAQHLLGGAGDSSERGWVALTLGMFERDRSLKHRRFEEALDVASATRDNDLAFSALAYFGASLVHADRVEEGMVRLDEALAAVVGGEVGDIFVVEEIFCQMLLPVSARTTSPALSNGSGLERRSQASGIYPPSSRIAGRTSAAS